MLCMVLITGLMYRRTTGKSPLKTCVGLQQPVPSLVQTSPGIPLRARRSYGRQGTIEPPSLTDILGIFIGMVYSPRIVLKAAEVHHPAAPWDVQKDPIVGHNTVLIGQHIGPDEHMFDAPVQHPGIWNRRSDPVDGRMAIEQRIGPDTQFLGKRGYSASTWDNEIVWPDDPQHIRLNGSFYAMQEHPDVTEGIQDDLTVWRSAAMVATQRVRSDTQLLEMQRLPSVSWNAQNRRMIWQANTRIIGQRKVIGGLFFKGANETNIWAPQGDSLLEYPSDRRSVPQGHRGVF
ncbi:uncharacterized protein BT62DRAFT_930409 [Guyanagaster necrorhizus]|uniref:Uncharacterized protein n=1 Tax=Guyanagaster necrorhizus TaxID=856835 RepID=A0A9P7VY25_9AGAR|nr:uncharacterized protein BT62DRAFT_930409 [Guyanagaster necrorhizus MCA 3950]KAG7448319.1 hypothetical protein BT62DRAFT_930409 [Guyanagaster necrorhizus MCA 3950]